MLSQNRNWQQHKLYHQHRRHQMGLNNFWIITAAVVTITALWSIKITPVSGAPTKIDSNVASLPLEQAAPIVAKAFAAAYEAAADKATTLHHKRATPNIYTSSSSLSASSIDDSYGNPIETLKPIDTPDGRKVVSAQGLQFEIPNYASGITEITKPADDLLPPFIGELTILGTQTENITKNINEIEKIHEQTKNAKLIDMVHQLNTNDEVDDVVIYGDNEKMKPLKADDIALNIDVNVDNVDVVPVVAQNKSIATIFISEVSTSPIDVDNNETQSVDDVDVHHQKQYSTTTTKSITMTTANEHQHHSNNDVNNSLNNKNYQDNRNSLHHQQLSKSSDALSPIFSLPLNNAQQVVNSYANYYNKQFSSIKPLTNLNSLPSQSESSNHIKHSKNQSKSIHHASSSSSSSSFSSRSSEYFNDLFSYFSKHSPTFSFNQLQHRPSAVVAPLSNGNFNYPDVPTDISVINRIAAKYHNPLPTLDPIAVALPNDDSILENTSAESYGAIQTDQTRSQHQQQQESIITPKIVAASNPNSNSLPEYLLELNDPGIGGPVEYTPEDDDFSLKVIAWDVLPPIIPEEPQIVTIENLQPKKVSSTIDPNTQNVHFTLSSGAGINAETPGNREKTQTNTVATNVETNGNSERVKFTIGSSSSLNNAPQLNESNEGGIRTREHTNYRGTAHFTSTTTTKPTLRTKGPTATTTTTTTTTTPRPTTKNIIRTTTTITKAPAFITTTTSAPVIDESEFLELAAGDSYTLPPWLASIKDEDLDVALSYVVPEDNDQYNHTVSRDILPPFEPFVDLNSINLPAPKAEPLTTTTKRSIITTSTTKSSSPPLTARPHWVRAKPTQATSASTNNHIEPQTTTFNSQTSSQTLPNTTIKPKLSTTISLTTTPRIAALNTNLSTDRINSEEVEQRISTPSDGKYNPKPKPFLKQQPLSTTTTTTTTTPTPEYEENPFDTAKIPDWLQAFDYPDLGPGIPYTPDVSNENIDRIDSTSNNRKGTFSNDLLPPTQHDTQATDTGKPFFVTTSPGSFPIKNFTPQTQTPSQFPTSTSFFHPSTTSTTSSNSFPSQSSPSNRIPTQTINNRNDGSNQIQEHKKVPTQPPIVFKPPTIADSGKRTQQHFNAQNDRTATTNTNSFTNTHFTAPFEPADTDLAPVSGSSTGVPPKTTYSKNDVGKVIKTPQQGADKSVFNTGVGILGGLEAQQKDFQSTQTTQFSSTVASSRNPFLPHPFNAKRPTTAEVSQTAARPIDSSAQTSSTKDRYRGKFGGPPGVLQPYDNVPGGAA